MPGFFYAPGRTFRVASLRSGSQMPGAYRVLGPESWVKPGKNNIVVYVYYMLKCVY